MSELKPLPLLADPATYQRCSWDLGSDASKRGYWVGVFRRHIPTMCEAAREVELHLGGLATDIDERLTRAKASFEEYLDAIERSGCQPQGGKPLDVLAICEARERVLREVAIADPYLLAKQRENETALKLLPALLKELDATDDADRTQAIIEGIFAGNIFDLGATDVAEKIAREGVDFHATRAKLPPRPWHVDGLDALKARLDRPGGSPPYRCALLFVDNAGCDVVLGMIPFARELLRRGVEVILTANTLPSLNDITHEELTPMVDGIAEWDETIASALRDGRLTLLASGNGYPLIDLTRVSSELVAAVRERGVDLLVLEGMGRGIESNFEARFTCDAMKIAMIKDAGVAEALGGKLYDVVLRFEPGQG